MRLQYCRPGEMSTDIAVILLDSEENCVRIQFTTDWNRYNEDEVEILTALEQDIQNKTADLGATELFRHLLETLSNAILITEPESLTTTDPQLTLDELHDRFLGCSEAPKEAILQRVAESWQKLRTTLNDLVVRQNDSASRFVRPFVDYRLRPRYGIAAASVCVAIMSISLLQQHRSIQRATPVAASPTVSRSYRQNPECCRQNFDAGSIVSRAPTLSRKVQMARRARISYRNTTANRQTQPNMKIKQFAVPEGLTPVPEVHLLQPDLVVHVKADVMLADMKLPILSPAPSPPPRRKNRVLQALAFPFRIFGN